MQKPDPKDFDAQQVLPQPIRFIGPHGALEACFAWTSGQEENMRKYLAAYDEWAAAEKDKEWQKRIDKLVLEIRRHLLAGRWGNAIHCIEWFSDPT